MKKKSGNTRSDKGRFLFTPEELQAKIDFFVKERQKTMKPLFMQSLYNYLDISKQTASRWQKDKRYTEIFEKFKNKCIENIFECGLMKMYDSKLVMFYMTNNTDMIEKQHIDQKTESNIKEQKTIIIKHLTEEDENNIKKQRGTNIQD